MDKQNFYSGTLIGSVACNEVVKLKWVTEPNACKKCQELEGKLFNSVEEFEAARPHPHCKCKYEVVRININEKQSENLSSDKINLINQIKELLKKLEYALENIQTEENLIQETLADKHRLSTTVIEALQKRKQDLTFRKKQIKNTIDDLEIAFKKLLIETELYLIDKGYIDKIKKILDIGINISSTFYPEAAALWQLSSSNFSKELDYIKKNGKLLNSFIDIEEPSLRVKVIEKLESQKMDKNSRGIRLRADSSFAKKLIDTPAFRRFIHEHKSKFKPNTTLNIEDNSLEFNSQESADMYYAVHNIDIEDIYIDFHENFTAKVIDTYDFNEGENNLLVIAGYNLQKEEKIKPYFIVVDIFIPKVIWENY